MIFPRSSKVARRARKAEGNGLRSEGSDWLGDGWLDVELGHLDKSDEVTLCIFCSCDQFAASDILRGLLRLSAGIED